MKPSKVNATLYFNLCRVSISSVEIIFYVKIRGLGFEPTHITTQRLRRICPIFQNLLTFEDQYPRLVSLFILLNILIQKGVISNIFSTYFIFINVLILDYIF